MIVNPSKIIGTSLPFFALLSKRNDAQHNPWQQAEQFLDWLKRSGQNAWVMLPLSESQLEEGSSHKHVPSPYKGYGIGIDPRYLPVGNNKAEDSVWIEQNSYWLDTYALFCALRDHFGSDDWREWDADIRDHTPRAVEQWTKKLATSIEHYKKEQQQLHAAYHRLKMKAQALDVFLVGDVPFYMSLRSPLVWAHQSLFQLGKGGELAEVSGILWGHFDRQIWGHPLYKWGGAEQREKVVNLWKMRLRYHAMLFDIVRIDHVKGLFKFGVINISDSSRDRYARGPGEQVLAQFLEYSKQIRLKIFVEDSGHYKLKEFLKAAKKHSLGGMKIYRFAYNEKKHSLNKEYANIAHYPENTVVYTSTHDTETLMGYLALLPKKVKQVLARHVRVSYSGDDKAFARMLRDAIIASPARMIIIPIQDWLLIKDRINTPGTEKKKNDPNWKYRVPYPIEELSTDL